MVNKVNIKTAIYHKIVTNYTKITVFYSVEGKKKTSAVGFKYPAAVVLVMIFWLSLSDPCRTAVPYKVPQLRQVAKIILVL